MVSKEENNFTSIYLGIVLTLHLENFILIGPALVLLNFGKSKRNAWMMSL